VEAQASADGACSGKANGSREQPEEEPGWEAVQPAYDLALDQCPGKPAPAMIALPDIGHRMHAERTVLRQQAAQ